MSKTTSRILIGLLIFSIVLFALYVGNLSLTLLLFLLCWQSNTEFINIVEAKGFKPSRKWLRFVSLLFIIIASLPFVGLPQEFPIKLYTFVFIFGVIGCFFRLVFRGGKKEHIATIADISTSVLGFIYTGLLPSFIILTRHFGFEYIFIPIVGTAFCDVGAYYGGKMFGKHKLKPEISPKKTLEGAISGFIISMISVVIMVYVFKSSFNFNIIHGVFIGLFTGIFSQFGDLFESLLKRDAGLKDSGDVLLSHGGVLDRIDSYLFVIWAVYFYISWIVLGWF